MKKRLKRCREILEEKQLDAVLITSSANRFYLSGFSGTSGSLIITSSGENHLVTDFRYIEQAEEEAKDFKIVEVSQKRRKKLSEHILSLDINSLGFEEEEISYKYYQEMKDYLQGLSLVPLEGSVSKLRRQKDEEEIDAIEEAIKISEAALKELLNFIEPGKSEGEIAAKLEYLLRQRGGEGPAFDFIVASGERSALPHGVASEKLLKNGEFVTIDFGTKYRGYCSDITRTFVMGEPDEKQEEIYEIVLAAQRRAIDEIEPGMSGQEADAVARDYIREEGYEDNFGHGLGHGLGIEVHEGPKLSSQSDDNLEPGMVFTDEPGIYISDFGGVRIEDDIFLTESGCRVLTDFEKELIKL